MAPALAAGRSRCLDCSPGALVEQFSALAVIAIARAVVEVVVRRAPVVFALALCVSMAA
jgi:hypothetical protein